LLQAASQLADISVAADRVQVQLSDTTAAVTSRTSISLAVHISIVTSCCVAGPIWFAKCGAELFAGWRRHTSPSQWSWWSAATIISSTHVDRANAIATVPIAKLSWTVTAILSAVTISVSVAHQ